MDQLAAFLHEFPALCLFLSILLGTIIGRFHFNSSHLLYFISAFSAVSISQP